MDVVEWDSDDGPGASETVQRISLNNLLHRSPYVHQFTVIWAQSIYERAGGSVPILV